MSQLSPHDALKIYALNLVQALLGAISTIFRRVQISHIHDEILITFYLESELLEDIEEIEDIISEFEALQAYPVKVRKQVEIGNQAMAWDNLNQWPVFLRREPHESDEYCGLWSTKLNKGPKQSLRACKK